MKKIAIRLTIGLVSFALTAAGLFWVAGLNGWASLGLGAALSVPTLAVFVLPRRVWNPVAWTRKELGGFMFFLGLFMIGNSVLAWFYTTPATALIGLLSGMLCAGAGAFESVQSRRTAR